MTVSGKRILPAALVLVILVFLISAVIPTRQVLAAQITTRSLTLQANGSTGGSTPAGTVNHQFAFTVPSSTLVQSIKFTYCTQARAQTCTMPVGMDSTGATLGTLTGLSGWTLHATTNGAPYISAASGTNASGADVVQLLSVKNPTAANTAFYVDIQTFASNNGTGSPVDDGWVAAATANQIQLSGTMPESLIFCTGDTISTTGGVPDCTTATNNTVAFNQLFSPTATAYATSQMAASTNASGGYVITESGATMTSGSNTIVPMDNGSGGSTTSVKGKSQFGMNLVLNDGTAYAGAPNIPSSANITPASTTSVLKGEATTNYATNGNFLFKSAGDTVADSYHGGAGGTDTQLYTISYIVNVDGAQSAGTYTTTLTYICTSTF